MRYGVSPTTIIEKEEEEDPRTKQQQQQQRDTTQGQGLTPTGLLYGRKQINTLNNADHGNITTIIDMDAT